MKHSIPVDLHGSHSEAMASAISKCVHCGFCLAACPTYQELGQETDSPRGRIVLMKEVLEGNLPIAEAMEHVDPCLGCLACEPACPSGVPYRDLISPFRALARSKSKGNWIGRVKRAVVESTLPYPKRFWLAVMVGLIFKPLASFMPATPRAMLDLLPDELPRRQAWKEVYAAKGIRRGRVALLTGCAQSILDPDINTATISVLTNNGVEVVVPKRQVCCGGLSWHGGNLAQAKKFAKSNMQAFPDDVDAIVTNAAGCGSAMKEYGLIFEGTAEHDAAKVFANRVVDVSEYLSSLGELVVIPGRGTQQRIAYHDACHLANAQNVRSQPRELLRQIPGVEVVEIAESHLCCGSAGTYNIDHPEVAASLGKQKAENVAATDCDLVASGNIGCLTQLKLHLAENGPPVRHTMQILRDAYRSTTP